MLWVEFILCSVLIFVFGFKLSDYAHAISKQGIFSAGLMGVLFLSVVTSCPEIFASLGSITIVNAPDLATGDLIGSVIFNLFAIALMAFFFKKSSILTGQTRSNILTATLTILMLGFLIGFIALRLFFGISWSIFNVGLGSIIIGLIYIAGIIIIYRHESQKTVPEAAPTPRGHLWAKFLISSIVIIAAGFWLARVGKAIVDTYGWNEMYVGLLLLAVATSLPEVVVSFTALKLGSREMAVGNILGSNFFNIFIIILLDIFYRKGSFLSFVSGLNAYSAFFAIILTGVVIFRMLKRGQEEKITRILGDSIAIIILFAVGHYMLFNLIYSR